MADKVPQLNDKFTKKDPKYQFVKKKLINDNISLKKFPYTPTCKMKYKSQQNSTFQRKWSGKIILQKKRIARMQR